jgi:hypothetical protein
VLQTLNNSESVPFIGRLNFLEMAASVERIVDVLSNVYKCICCLCILQRPFRCYVINFSDKYTVGCHCIVC